jgi:hypothetical protein
MLLEFVANSEYCMIQQNLLCKEASPSYKIDGIFPVHLLKYISLFRFSEGGKKTHSVETLSKMATSRYEVD